MITFILVAFAFIYLMKGTEVWAEVAQEVWNRPETQTESRVKKITDALIAYPLVVLIWPWHYIRDMWKDLKGPWIKGLFFLA